MMRDTKYMLIGLVSLLIVALFLAGCGTAPTPVTPGGGQQPGTTTSVPGTGTYVSSNFDPKAAISSQNFNSVSELNSFLQSHSGNSYPVLMAGGVMRNDLAVPTAVAGGAVKSSETAGSSSTGTANAPAPATGATQTDYSQTNNQVAGVDEADLIKTDGTYIYTISGNTVLIIDAYPGENASIISRITLNTTPSNLFIRGNYLAVFGDFYDPVYFKAMDIRPVNGMTFFSIYDISDKANPVLVKDYKFEGNYFDARMKDGYVYFVVRTSPEIRPYPMPLMYVNNVKTEMPVSNIRYYNLPYDNPSMVSVHAINLNDISSDLSSESIMVEGGENLYMSENNIYITYTEYVNEYTIRQQVTMDLLADKLSDSDKALIEKIKAVDNDVLSKSEKDAKIMQIYYTYINYLPSDDQQQLNDQIDKLVQDKLKEYDYLEYTIINKINVDAGKIVVEDTGKVPGHIVNQFSLDESNNVLRIATTVSPSWSYSGEQSTKSTNGVYALDSGMKILGRLENIAEDESIQSTRFIGDKLYMITSKQIDPLFVIDLSNPSNIKELGNLKLPGFVTYLQAYDENTLIGIGDETTDMGRVTGLKISLFDVSDFSNPKEIVKFVTSDEYASSTALYEHKAFLFSKDKELLVIPAYSYNYDYRTGANTGYNGAFVFKINKNEITLRGLIDHSMGQPAYYGAQVERSLYINDLLYTKSESLLRINRIDDLSSVKNLSLSTTTSVIPIY